MTGETDVTTAAVDLTSETLANRIGPPVEITGYLIGRVSTKMGAPEQQRSEPKTRWSVNSIWKLRDGTYVLVRESWSRIYHTHPTRCRTAGKLPKGDRTTASAMFDELEDMGFHYDDDAVPCDECRPFPPEELANDDVIRFEFVRRSIDRCETPAQVVDPLINIPKFGGRKVTVVSKPVKDLLEQAATNDPDWEAADQPVERIG